MTTALASACTATIFTPPTVFGAEILSIKTALVTHFSASVLPALRFTQPAIEVHNSTFCNVTVTYTHPGQNDNVIVEAWLPIENPPWNERLQAVGGGGFAPGRFAVSYETMKGALGDGYATVTTDAGVGSSQEPSSWALLSPGNVNLYKLRNLASVSLNDEALISKSLIRSFYGKVPAFSYWNGCSQGGRQGLVLAQRYPDAYHGIAAGAPAIYWLELFASMQWPEVFMNDKHSYPHPCELDAITSTATKECDVLDGAVDGIIADVDACLTKFDPFKVVGQPLNCSLPGAPLTISRTAAAVANTTWRGAYKRDGARIWYGLSPGADITGHGPYAPTGGTSGVARTNCTSGACRALTFPLADYWVRLFLAKDPFYNAGNMTRSDFESFLRLAKQEYHSLVGSDDADLSDFRAAGGKLVTWHGLDDIIVPPGGTSHYHAAVGGLMHNIDTFYRHYEVPGMAHCFGGPTGQPTRLFDQLRGWVENGTVPEASPIDINVANKTHHRIICPYPLKTKFNKGCGDTSLSRCWACKR